MKRFFLLLCLCIVITSVLSPAAALAAKSGVTSAQVVLRQKADQDSKALQTLPKGEEVTILGNEGSFYRVRYGSFKGYLMKKYVSVSSKSEQDQIRALGTPPGIMRIGDENSDVKKLQQALSILGYYDGKADGIYGNGTVKAVKAYQKDEGLEADGYAGEMTVKSIFGSCSSTSLTTQPKPDAKPAAIGTKRVVEQQYEQRTYDAKEYDDIPEDQLKEMTGK